MHASCRDLIAPLCMACERARCAPAAHVPMLHPPCRKPGRAAPQPNVPHLKRACLCPRKASTSPCVRHQNHLQLPRPRRGRPALPVAPGQQPHRLRLKGRAGQTLGRARRGGRGRDAARPQGGGDAGQWAPGHPATPAPTHPPTHPPVPIPACPRFPSRPVAALLTARLGDSTGSGRKRCRRRAECLQSAMLFAPDAPKGRGSSAVSPRSAPPRFWGVVIVRPPRGQLALARSNPPLSGQRPPTAGPVEPERQLAAVGVSRPNAQGARGRTCTGKGAGKGAPEQTGSRGCFVA
jgi:hypothetical protein